MSKTYDEIKQMKVSAVAYDPTVFDSTKSVLEQLEIIKEYISEFPTGFVIWGAIEGIDSYVSQISSLSLYPIGRDEDIANPKVGDLVLFRDGTVHLISGVRQSGPSRFTVSIDAEVLVNLKGPKGDSVKGDPGIGFNNLSSIDFTYGQSHATFSTDEGMILSGGGRAVLEDNTSFEFATEIEVPFVPGEGIAMDANEDNEAVVISLDPEVSSDLGRAIKQPPLPVKENSVPVVKPDMDIDYVPVSSLGGGAQYMPLILISPGIIWNDSSDYDGYFLIPKGFSTYTFYHSSYGELILKATELNRGSGSDSFSYNSIFGLQILPSSPYADSAYITTYFYGVRPWNFMSGTYEKDISGIILKME